MVEIELLMKYSRQHCNEQFRKALAIAISGCCGRQARLQDPCKSNTPSTLRHPHTALFLSLLHEAAPIMRKGVAAGAEDSRCGVVLITCCNVQVSHGHRGCFILLLQHTRHPDLAMPRSKEENKADSTIACGLRIVWQLSMVSG